MNIRTWCIGIAVAMNMSASAYAVDKAAEKGAPAAAPDADAETVCEADVFYSWKRLPPPPAPGATAAAAAASPFEPEEVFFQKIIKRGTAKEALEAEVKSNAPSVEGKAREACVRLHENAGLCVADAVSLLGGAFSSLDFETRRVVRDRVVGDCAATSGQCLKTRVGDTTCRTDAPVVVATPASEKKK